MVNIVILSLFKTRQKCGSSAATTTDASALLSSREGFVKQEIEYFFVLSYCFEANFAVDGLKFVLFVL
jgi:hypothetical protein